MVKKCDGELNLVGSDALLHNYPKPIKTYLCVKCREVVYIDNSGNRITSRRARRTTRKKEEGVKKENVS